MLVGFLLAFVAAQSGMISNSTSPPPIVAVTPIPPPPIMAVRDGPAESFVAVPIRVRVSVGNQILFDDVLRAGRNSAATFEQSRSEAPAGPCPANRSYGYGNRQSLRVQIYYVDVPQSGPSARVSVNWQRPSGSGDCSSEGSRTVAIAESVPLQPGQTATVQGDGGLVVTLTRR